MRGILGPSNQGGFWLERLIWRGAADDCHQHEQSSAAWMEVSYLAHGPMTPRQTATPGKKHAHSHGEDRRLGQPFFTEKMSKSLQSTRGEFSERPVCFPVQRNRATFPATTRAKAEGDD